VLDADMSMPGKISLKTAPIITVVGDARSVLFPPDHAMYDAVVYLWARQSELAGCLDTRLYSAVKVWVAKEWPFKKVAFPGRDIDWETWRQIPDEKR
jgi:hypothetical protein